MASPASPAARPRSLARNVAWTLAGTTVYAACQWLTIIVLARAGSTRSVGQYALGLATTAPIVLLLGLQLRDVQATDARREYAFADYLGLRLLSLAVAAVVVVGAALVASSDRQAFWTVLLVGAAKIFESLSDVHYGMLQQHERMDQIAISLLVRGTLGLAAVAAGQILTGTAVGAAAAIAVVWAVVALTLDRGSARRVGLSPSELRPRFSRARLVPLLRLSAPMGVVLMLVSLEANVPRYFVQRWIGTDELGVFAALSSLFVAGNLLVNAVGQSAAPRLARAFAAGERGRFLRPLAWMMAGAAALGAGGTMVAAVAGAPLLGAVFGNAYALHHSAFVAMMATSVVAYPGSILGYAMSATRRFAVQLPLFAAAVAVDLVACALLVRPYGLVGAAMAWGLALLLHSAGAAAIVAAALRRAPRAQ